MCGLVGLYTFDRSRAPDSEALGAGVNALVHRGPDARSQHVAAGIGLGHTRLSFLDLSPEGNQPMWDEAHRYCIVYNGEIYNFLKLRESLQRSGCQFKTGSDTEVLLQGLISEGPPFLVRAEGMFAFALYDSYTHRLVLGRDRFGIKPLFWGRDGSRVIFASELKALRQLIHFSPDERRLAAFLGGLDLPTANESMICGISFFPAGCSAQIDSNGNVEVTPFFQLSDFWATPSQEALRTLSETEIIDKFDNLLNEAVESHMLADVPVGALCSGGVDSSIILALAKQHSTSLAIYHANVLGPQSEYNAAKALAQHLNLDLMSVDVRDEDFIDNFSEVLAHLEFPFLYHPNSIPFLLVSKLVKSHGTKAVLTGEGSDEILLGYSHIPLMEPIHSYHSLLDSVRKCAHRLPWLGRILWRTPGDRQASIARQILSGFEDLPPPDLISSISAPRRQRRVEVEYRLLDHHLRTLLMRNDRLGMASSIEARFPFLSHALVSFAVNLPAAYKMRFSLHAADEIRHPFVSTKWILRKVATRYLPRELAFRAKRGFPTSAFDRIKVDPSFLDNSWVSDHYRLDTRALRHLSDECSSAERLRLLMLEAWARIVLCAERPSSVQTVVRQTLHF